METIDFEGEFELFQLEVRRLISGHKNRLVLEMEDDMDTHIQLIKLRDRHIRAKLTLMDKYFSHESVYEIFDIKVRKLAGGNKLCLILENLYRKEDEEQLVKMRFQEVQLTIEIIEKELFDSIQEPVQPQEPREEAV